MDGTLIEAWASHKSFGWIKTVGGLAKPKLIGQAKLSGQALLCFATYNPVRMGSIGGWWDDPSCVSPGIRAPETGNMACKQASMAVGIASQTHLGHSFLRNPRSWCVR